MLYQYLHSVGPRFSRTAHFDPLAQPRVDVTNSRVIPTIMVEAAETKLVRPDILTFDGCSASAITAGVVLNEFQPGPLSMSDQKDLKRNIIRNGLPGKTTRTIESLMKRSGPVTIQYSALKGARPGRRAACDRARRKGSHAPPFGGIRRQVAPAPTDEHQRPGGSPRIRS